MEHRGFYPLHALPQAIRRRLDAVFDPGGAALAGAARGAEVTRLRKDIANSLTQAMGKRRTADGQLILSYESDQELELEAARPWIPAT